MKKFIPSLFTCGNAVAGFLSLIAATQGLYMVAAWLLVAAACMDSLDGRAARALGMTTVFGKELDSLADVVSFCIAPAVLLYVSYVSHVDSSAVILLICLSLYVCAGLARLARFNTMTIDQSLFFVGLPTPLGGLLLVQLVIFQSWLIRSFPLLTHPIALALVVLAVAGLFVSRIPFFAFKKAERPLVKYGLPGVMGACFVAGFLHGSPLFLLVTVSYIVGSCVWCVYKK